METRHFGQWRMAVLEPEKRVDARHTCRASQRLCSGYASLDRLHVLAVGENDSRQDTILDTQVIAEQTLEYGTQVGCGLQVAIRE